MSSPAATPSRTRATASFSSTTSATRFTREFLGVYNALLAGETVNFDGKHIQDRGGQLLFPPLQSPRPPLYFGGSSDAGIEVAAEQSTYT